MRSLAIRGAPFTGGEMAGLLDYCQRDAEALAALWAVVGPRLDDRALLRGEYMKSVALMEWRGIPVDAETLNLLDRNWQAIKNRFIGEIDPGGAIWQDGRFSELRFENWLQERHLQWPRLASGRLALDQATWSDMGGFHPLVRPLSSLRSVLGMLKLAKPAVGPDGRNRTLLSPFGSASGRNCPSTTKFIFNNHRWLRPLIRPEPGRALAYID